MAVQRQYHRTNVAAHSEALQFAQVGAIRYLTSRPKEHDDRGKDPVTPWMNARLV
jgi:hypothetical protein